MNTLRIVLLAGAVILAALVTWAVIDRFRLASVVAAHADCAKAAETNDRVLTSCATPIVDRVIAARAATVCEASIAAQDLFGIRTSCGASVKLTITQLDAVRADILDVRAQLADATSDRDAAIGRAEGRATTLTQRIASNDQTIDAAPRNPVGGVRCDAECVRRIAGDRTGTSR